MADHLNNIERTLIDNLRTGTYKTATSTATAWSSSDVHVFGQFPETEEAKYPSIIVSQRVNGIEEQFLGMLVGEGASTKRGEMYGIGIDIHLMVDENSVITVDGTGYKQRRLLNYLMGVPFQKGLYLVIIPFYQVIIAYSHAFAAVCQPWYPPNTRKNERERERERERDS